MFFFFNSQLIPTTEQILRVLVSGPNTVGQIDITYDPTCRLEMIINNYRFSMDKSNQRERESGSLNVYKQFKWDKLYKTNIDHKNIY